MNKGNPRFAKRALALVLAVGLLVALTPTLIAADSSSLLTWNGVLIWGDEDTSPRG
jgi:hypothetical protein